MTCMDLKLTGSVGCVVYEMVLEKSRDSYVSVHREVFPTFVRHAAVSILKGFLKPIARHRLGARGEKRSIMRHRFFKNVNWEALLKKHDTPPFKPLTFEFLTSTGKHLEMEKTLEIHIMNP